MADNKITQDGTDILRTPFVIAEEMYRTQLEDAVTQLEPSRKKRTTQVAHSHGISLAELRDAMRGNTGDE